MTQLADPVSVCLNQSFMNPIPLFEQEFSREEYQGAVHKWLLFYETSQK